tara:strand:+ start:1093 stop:1317 length:225 start_codon:yes stop_codon:yes gene_type:complete
VYRRRRVSSVVVVVVSSPAPTNRRGGEVVFEQASSSAFVTETDYRKALSSIVGLKQQGRWRYDDDGDSYKRERF